MMKKIASLIIILSFSGCLKNPISDQEDNKIGIDTILTESSDEINKTKFHQWLKNKEDEINDTIISSKNFFIHFKESNELIFRGRLQGIDFVWPEIANPEHIIDYLPRFYYLENQRMYFLQGHGFHFRILTVVSTIKDSIALNSFENQHTLNSNDNAFLFLDYRYPNKLFSIGDFNWNDSKDLIELKTITIPESYSDSQFESADWGIGNVTANFSGNIHWTFSTEDLESHQW